MTKYHAVIVSGRNEKQLQDSINITLKEFAQNGWKLHSQANWFRNLGGVFEEWFKCTLIFEKESDSSFLFGIKHLEPVKSLNKKDI